MENNQKKKYTLEIAGTSLTLVSDEGDAFVKAVSTKLDSRMSELLKSSFRVSILDAAILCALDYLGEDVKAEKKIRSLETQLELYEVKMRNMAEELDRRLLAERALSYVNSILSARERQIIFLRYGIGINKPHTQKETSTRLGISRSYVSRLEKAALEKLKNALGSE